MRPEANPSRSLLTGFLVAIAALLAFAWLAVEVMGGATLPFDEAIRSQVHQFASPVVTAMMRAISFAGAPELLVPLGVLIIFFCLRTRKPRIALLFTITVFGAEALDQILKHVFHRARPMAFFGLAQPSGYSFPSGHALVCCAFYGLVSAYAAERAASEVRRWSYRVVAALFIAAIGLSRIYLGVHYPTDVLGGYIAAAFWLFSVATVRRSLRAHRGV